MTSDADLTVYSGSTHQADRRLSDVSRVRQYAFTAMLLNVQTPAACFAMDARHSR